MDTPRRSRLLDNIDNIDHVDHVAPGSPDRPPADLAAYAREVA